MLTGCDPLHIKPDIYLKLHTNCTRRAHWLSKLGYTAVPEPLAISLSSILARGGLVPQIKVVLARVYPMLYMERNTGGKVGSGDMLYDNYNHIYKYHIGLIDVTFFKWKSLVNLKN